MSFEKNEQENLQKTQLRWQRPYKHIRKVAIITLLLAGFGFDTASAQETEYDGLQKIFHIYSDGEYIGTLSHAEKLDRLKDDKLQKAASEFENLPLTVGNDLSIISEQVFKADIDDNVVLEKLQKMLAVKAEAVSIKVDGEPALYVNDLAAYDEVVRKLKLQSVTEEELNEFEARNGSNESLPPLELNETRISNILMIGNVQVENEIVAPDEILSVEEALSLLNKGTLEEKKYTVQAGDVLGRIANDHGMPTATLLEINPDLTAETVIQPGDEINITILEPLVNVEVHYETKQTQPISFNNITKEDSSIYKGDKKITQKGSDGEKIVTESIQKRNNQIVGRTVLDEEIISEPTDQMTLVGTKVMPSRGVGLFSWPTSGGYVSSSMGNRWGSYHRGIDIARTSSSTVKAADNGVVTFAGWQGNYGKKVVINHNNGYETTYAHLSSINVKVGQTVPKGTKVGVIGSTGRSTGVHLHFEVTKNGSLVNPMNVLR